MPTDVDICNAALGMLGAKGITALDSATPSDREQNCRELYPQARGFVLRSHSWNCNERRAWLTDPQIDPYDIDVTIEEVNGVTVRGTYVEPGSAGGNICRGTTRANSGAVMYFEVEVVATPEVTAAVGVMTATADRVTSIGGQATGWAYLGSGQKQGAAASAASYGAAWAKGDRIGILWNATAGSLTFYRNGVSEGVAFASGVAGYLHPTVFATSALRVFLQSGDWLYPPTGATAWSGDALPAEYADFGYRLWLPNDCLRVYGIGEKDDIIDYRLKGRELMLDQSSVLLVYGADVAEDAFDEMLAHSMSVYLASLLAYPVAKSTSLADWMLKRFQGTISPSRSVDGMEQPMNAPQQSRFMNARLRGG